MTSSPRASRHTQHGPRGPRGPHSSDRSLQVVPDYSPTLRDRLGDRGLTPVRLLGAGVAAVAAVVALSQVPKIGERPSDPRTEQNNAREEHMLAPLFANNGERVQLPYKAAEVEINQFQGTVSIEINATGTENRPVTIKLRDGPFRQRDLDNGVIEDSNASLEIGSQLSSDERLRDATKVTFDGALTATFANGDTWVGGIPLFDGDERPDISTMTAEEFSDHMVWANISSLDQPYSGATVHWDVDHTADETANARPDLSVLGGPATFSGVPTARIQ